MRRRIPPFRRVVMIESGSRQLLEDLLPVFYQNHGPNMRLDLVTCFSGTPKAFRNEFGQVYRVTEFTGREGRKQLYRLLSANQYDICGMICSGEPIMTKWKWMLAARLPAKILVLNENGDYFFADRSTLGIIQHFVLYRAGLTGAGAVATLLRLALFPLTFAYLLLYAATAHLGRRVRT
ncbi:MAG: hypothetical protein ABI972_07305 [Acidobacteriota bacterium]